MCTPQGRVGVARKRAYIVFANVAFRVTAANAKKAQKKAVGRLRYVAGLDKPEIGAVYRTDQWQRLQKGR